MILVHHSQDHRGGQPYESWKVPSGAGPIVEVTSWGHLRLRYRLTQIVVWGDKVTILYGVRVRRDGVSFGHSIPLSGNYREVTTL